MGIFSKAKSQKVLAKVVLEVVGKPKTYVEQSLLTVISEIKALDVKVVSEKIHPGEEKENYFSAFAELEVQFTHLPALMDFCFDFMPSSVDIMEPHEFEGEISDITMYLNDLLARLHGTDMVAKNLRAENAILQRNSSHLLRNLLTLSLKDKKQNIDSLSKDCGIPKDQLAAFLDGYLKEGWIGFEDELYFVI